MDGTLLASIEALICDNGTWETTHKLLWGPRKDGSEGMSRGKKNWSEFLRLDNAFEGKAGPGAEGNWELNYMIKGLVHKNDEIENNKDLFPIFPMSKGVKLQMG